MPLCVAAVRLPPPPPSTRPSGPLSRETKPSASTAPAAHAATTARPAIALNSLISMLLFAPSRGSQTWTLGRSASQLGPPDRHRPHPDVALAGAHRDFLAALAADAGLHEEVLADRVDRHQRLQAVADQGRPAAGPGHLAPLDQVALGDAEDEVAGRRVDLAAGEGDGVEAFLDLGDHRLWGGVAGGDVGVGHARDRQVAEALAAAVAGRGDTGVPGGEAVIQGGGGPPFLAHPPLYGRRPLLFVRVGAPPTPPAA